MVPITQDKSHSEPQRSGRGIPTGHRLSLSPAEGYSTENEVSENATSKGGKGKALHSSWVLLHSVHSSHTVSRSSCLGRFK